jgi:hypothetical protein
LNKVIPAKETAQLRCSSSNQLADCQTVVGGPLGPDEVRWRNRTATGVSCGSTLLSDLPGAGFPLAGSAATEVADSRRVVTGTVRP